VHGHALVGEALQPLQHEVLEVDLGVQVPPLAVELVEEAELLAQRLEASTSCSSSCTIMHVRQTLDFLARRMSP